jgi:hypothetical protein
VHVDGGEAVLLPEWAGGSPGEPWAAAASYGAAAEALGRAQAPFLRGRPLLAVPWLSKRFLREYSTEKPVRAHGSRTLAMLMRLVISPSHTPLVRGTRNDLLTASVVRGVVLLLAGEGSG